jgi:electron transfer flavoprotein beta subunit
VRILACVKRVPSPGAKIVVTADGQAVDTNMLGFAVSPHEECAAEEAIQQIEQHGGSSTVLTLGPAEAEEQLRTILSVGVDEAVLLTTDGSDWDPMATARALTTAIGELEAAGGPFDLILFGNESADSGGYQVGVRVAGALGRPIVSGIKGVDIVDGKVTARRDTPTGAEVYKLPLPAVLAIKEGINLPRYPTLKGRLGAKKKEVTVMEASGEPGGQVMLTLLAPPSQETPTEILGTGADAAPAVVDVLEGIGVL